MGKGNGERAQARFPRLRRAAEKVREAFSYLNAKKYTTLAGTLTFFLVMSVVPFLFWLTLLFGRLNIDFEQLLDLSIFDEVRDVILYFQESAQSATAGASVVLLATTLYSSTNLFFHMRRSGEIIYEYKRRKGSLVLRLSALVLIFIVMLLFLSGVGLFLVGNLLIERLFPSFVAKISVYLLVGVVAFAFLLLMNLYICPYRCTCATRCGGAFYPSSWAASPPSGSRSIRISAPPKKLYGAAVFFILFLLWLYVLMICFVVGVIFNCRLAERSGLRVQSKRF